MKMVKELNVKNMKIKNEYEKEKNHLYVFHAQNISL